LQLSDGTTLSLNWAKKDRWEGGGKGAGEDGAGIEGNDNSRKRGRDEGGILHIPSPPNPDIRSLFVGGLPPQATTHQIEELFRESGEGRNDGSEVADGGACVLNVRRPEGRDYAFVEFPSPSLALDALTRLLVKMHEMPGSQSELEGGKRDVTENDEREVKVGRVDACASENSHNVESEAMDAHDINSKNIEAKAHPHGLGEECCDAGSMKEGGRERGETVTKKGGGCKVILLGHAVTVAWAKGTAACPPPSSHSLDCWFCMASPAIKVCILVIDLFMRMFRVCACLRV